MPLTARRARLLAATYGIALPRPCVPGRAAGGIARAAALPAERRREIARQAAAARWGRRRARAQDIAE